MKENVVDNYRAEFMTSIHTRYKSILDDLGVKCTRYSVQALTEKILNHLGACIVVTRGSKKQGHVLHNIDMLHCADKNWHAPWQPADRPR